MAQEVFLRTAAGIISADKFNDAISPFKPTRHMASAVFVREEQYLNATTSTSLGATSRWEVNKDGDYLDKVWLTVSMAALTKNASASFARYCDWLGYALIKEFRAIYGPQILQRINKDQLFVWAQRFLSDEEYVHNARQVAGGLDDATRILLASQPQYLKVPIHTLWINNSPTQSLCLQALGNKPVRIHCPSLRNSLIPRPLKSTLSPASTSCSRTTPARSRAPPPSPRSSAARSTASIVALESNTCTSPPPSAMPSSRTCPPPRHRVTHPVSMYRARKGLRYLINDVQRPPDQVIGLGQNISGVYSYQLLNITQPVFSMHFLLRWQNDLTATYTSAQQNAVYGRNWFNCNGWLQPAGTSLPLRPMFTNLQMKSGNNNLLYQATIFDFLDDKAVRYYKNGASTVRGIPSACFAHVPTAPNSCSGSIDFSVVNQPIVFWTFNPTSPYTAVSDWSTQDIGYASNLVISGIFMTHNNIDATNYDLIRPFN
jgi:hypothetical protein